MEQGTTRAIHIHNRFAAKKAEWALENAAGMTKVEETFESIEKWLPVISDFKLAISTRRWPL